MLCCTPATDISTLHRGGEHSLRLSGLQEFSVLALQAPLPGQGPLPVLERIANRRMQFVSWSEGAGALAAAARTFGILTCIAITCLTVTLSP